MALAIWPYTSREFHIYANKQSLILFTGMLWEVKCIDLIHKWWSIYNSFVEVQISLPSLNTLQ